MRKVREWIGANDDTAIPPRVKDRIFKLFNGQCAICTRPVRGRHAYDHIKAICNGGENRESNLRLLCVSPCHAEKTLADVAEKAKVARKRKKHLGIRKPRSIRAWRKFDGTIVRAERER